MTNELRARKAEQVLREAYDNGEDFPIQEILIDLRHLCGERGLDFATQDRAAQKIYELERKDNGRQTTNHQAAARAKSRQP
jgi:hypothetical protein